MAELTRRTALVMLGVAGGVAALGYALRNVVDMPSGRMKGPGMDGVSGTDMSRYMNMFSRHDELRRTVEEIPGGIRTTTESDSPDLVAELQAHVSSMYTHVEEGAEVTCMSSSLPMLFRRAGDYRRQITFTPKGLTAVETASDPTVTAAIREHAREVTGFVDEGMPAMMRDMMGGGMMHGMGS
jgi:hypothetical protein